MALREAALSSIFLTPCSFALVKMHWWFGNVKRGIVGNFGLVLNECYIFFSAGEPFTHSHLITITTTVQIHIKKKHMASVIFIRIIWCAQFEKRLI